MHGTEPYATTSADDVVRRHKFFFESVGNNRIVKLVEYTAIQQAGDRVVFNLGFGDYEAATGRVSDQANSNNGDMLRVFSTVLSTVPLFFGHHPNDVVVVQGSDSDESAALVCLATCRKKCVGRCKNIDRRIKTYRYFVEKHFAELTKEYVIFGSYKDDLDDFVQYCVGEEYAAILVYRKH